MGYPVVLTYRHAAGLEPVPGLLSRLTTAGGVVDNELPGDATRTVLVAMPRWDTPVITVRGQHATADLSWGMSAKEFRTAMFEMVMLAKRVGFELFDPQLGAPVTEETLPRMFQREPVDALVLITRLNAGGGDRVRADEAEPVDFPPEYARGEIYRGDPLLAVPTAALELSVRASRVLRNAGINYIGELVTSSEAILLETPACGRRTLHELQDVLGRAGLRFKMRVLDWA